MEENNLDNKNLTFPPADKNTSSELKTPAPGNKSIWKFLLKILSIILITYLVIMCIVAAIHIYGNLTGNRFYLIFENENDQKACTMEAMICPDGSSVGRSGPNCEFTPCPNETPLSTANWKTYENNYYGFTLSYPNDWEISKEDYKTNKTNSPFVTISNPINETKIEFIKSKNISWSIYCPDIEDENRNYYPFDQDKDILIYTCGSHSWFDFTYKMDEALILNDFTAHDIFLLFSGINEDNRDLIIDIIKSTKFRNIEEEITYTLPEGWSSHSFRTSEVQIRSKDKLISVTKKEKDPEKTAVNQKKDELKSGGKEFSSPKYISSNNYWHFYVLGGGEWGPYDSYIFEDDNFIWSLECRCGDEDDMNKDDSEIDQILSTFKFTD